MSNIHINPQTGHGYRWVGGRVITAKGYILIWLPTKKYVMEHRWIMEQHLGRPLKKTELVHHIDGNRKNNCIENLEIISRGSHSRHHNRKRLPASQESRQKMRNMKLGRKLPEWWKEKIKLSLIAYSQSPEGRAARRKASQIRWDKQ